MARKISLSERFRNVTESLRKLRRSRLTNLLVLTIQVSHQERRLRPPEITPSGKRERMARYGKGAGKGVKTAMQREIRGALRSGEDGKGGK
jgi:hypothetical protein